MSTVTVTIEAKESLGAAVDLMRRLGLRHLLVLEGGTLAGVVSERDVHTALPSALAGGDAVQYEDALDTVAVGQLMVREPRRVGPRTPAYDAVELMEHYRIGCLPVTERGQVVGIVTRADCLRLLARLLRDGSTRYQLAPPSAL